MKKVFSKNLLKNPKNNILTPLISLIVIFAILSVLAWLQPTSGSIETLENDVQINTNYEYQATYTENILFPEGGTHDPGETMLRRILSEIPIQLNSTIASNSLINVEGTYDVKLVIQAEQYWEKEFQLKDKQSFTEEGNEINLFKDESLNLNFKEIEDYIFDVEEEISIRPNFYSLLIYPNVEGTVNHNNMSQEFQANDPLIFQIYNEEIILASEQQFTTPLPFQSKEVSSNTFIIFGIKIPVVVIQLTSTIITLLLVLTFIYIRKKMSSLNQVTEPLESEKIFHKYKKRLVPVSQKMDTNEEMIIHLCSFSSILQIADAKDLPIFFYDNLIDQRKLYFAIDEGYVYQFELIENDILLNNKSMYKTEDMKKESDSIYVLDQ